MRNRRLLIAVALAALYVPANAAMAADSASKVDPAEKINRVGYAIHEFFDRHLIRPVALGYQAVVPSPLRDGIRHFMDNLGEPSVAANDVLQGRFKKARTATLRFATNSTFGVLGFFDMATPAGLPRHDNGFDLTLGRAGVKPGPYLFIPLIGPTTVRDAVGGGVNILLDPLHGILAKELVNGVDLRARADSQLTAVKSDATDPYATLRSVYLQNQRSRIADNATTLPPLPDFDEDATPDTSPAPQAPKTDPTIPALASN